MPRLRASDDIPIWENVRRREVLLELRSELVKYFNSVEPDAHYGDVIETAEAQKARGRINMLLEAGGAIVSASGVSTTYVQYPAPAVGGHVKTFDVLQNVFHLHQAFIGPQITLDAIERALGVLEQDISAARRRTLNPLYWLKRLLEYVLSLPFRLLSAAGFNADRLERSWFGRTFRLLGFLLALVASVATVLEFLGWRDAVAEWVRRVLVR